MTTTVNVNQSKAMRTLVYIFVLAAVALATSFARGEDRPFRALIAGSVQVKQIVGTVEYAYDSAEWHSLTVGKTLRAGASIRTGEHASVIIAMQQEGSLVRVGPSRRLELAAAAPEQSVTIVPVKATASKAAADTQELASK